MSHQAITLLPDNQVIEDDHCDDLARSGAVANFYAEQTEFERYHQKRAKNTKDRQLYDLRVFSEYLCTLGVKLEAKKLAQRLYDDAAAWRGIEPGHVEGFIEWQRLQGFAVGSIKVRLSTVKKYCTLAFKSGAIHPSTHTRIKAIQGYTFAEGINVDETRRKQGLPTRQGRKKAEPTTLSRQQVRRLKIAKVDASKRSRRRAHDEALEARDTLLIHLFTEHGFRCSECVGLNIEHFDLVERAVRIWRSKTAKWYTYQMTIATYEAVQAYLATQNRPSGPLFVGYGGKRIHRNTLNERIKTLGLEAGITAHKASSQGSPLSPHDLRNRWAYDVIGAGNPLDQVQFYGGWTSEAMPLHYAKKAGVAYGPLKLPD